MWRTTMIALCLTACGSQPGAGKSPLPTSPAASSGSSSASSSDPSSDPSSNSPIGHTDSGSMPDGENILADVLAMNGEEYGAPQSTFRAGHVTPRQSPQVKRTKNGFEVKLASNAPVTTPAVYSNRVYVSGGFHSREFYALEAKTGQPVWSIALDDDGPSSPVCADNVCVFNTESCTVFAVDARTGKMLWSWWLGDPLTSAPTIAGGRVFTSYPAGAAEGGKQRPPRATHALIAFDLATGKIQWQKWLEGDVISAPVASGEFVYVSTFAGAIMKLEQATGKIRYAMRARATSAPVVDFRSGRESMYYTRRGEADEEADGAQEMIIRADDNEPKTRYKARSKKAGYLDKNVQRESSHAKKGKDEDSANGFGGGAPSSAKADFAEEIVGQGSVSTMQAFQGSRILHLGDSNVNTMGDEVVGTNAETGVTVWTYKLAGNLAHEGGALGTAPLSAGKSVLFATLVGDVIRLDPRDGKVQATYKTGARVRSQPVVADGWIYIGTEDGRLIAVNTGDTGLTGWPMWGGNAARTGISTLAR